MVKDYILSLQYWEKAVVHSNHHYWIFILNQCNRARRNKGKWAEGDIDWEGRNKIALGHRHHYYLCRKPQIVCRNIILQIPRINKFNKVAVTKINMKKNQISVQFSSAAQSCSTLCNPMDCSTPGFPVYHQLPELAQTHVHLIGDAIQSSHPLSSPSLPAFNLSQYLGPF